MDAVMWLRSKQVLVGVLVLALVAQMPHAQRVFYSMGHDANWFGWIQSWAAALALEVAVLVFVVRSNVRVSWAFAAFSIAINLMYYYDGVTPYIAPLLLAAGLPIAIALYSHEVAHDEVKAVQKEVHASRDDVQEAVQMVQPVVQPDAEVVQIEVVAPFIAPLPDADDVQPDALDRRERALNMMREGFKNAEIAVEVDAPLATVQSWRRRYFNTTGVHV